MKTTVLKEIADNDGVAILLLKENRTRLSAEPGDVCAEYLICLHLPCLADFEPTIAEGIQYDDVLVRFHTIADELFCGKEQK